MPPADDLSAIICPACGRRYAPGFIFCPVDGAELPRVGQDDSLDLASQETTQRPLPNVRGLSGGGLGLLGGFLATAVLLIVVIVVGIWWSVRPYELVVTFRDAGQIQAGDRVFVGKSTIGSVTHVDSAEGLQTARIRFDDNHAAEIIQGARFFSLPEVPLVSPQGIHVYLPNGPADRIANRSRHEGETSAAEYIALIAREKGLAGFSDFTSGFGELIIPSSRKRSSETQGR